MIRDVLYEDDDHLLYERDGTYYYEEKETNHVETLSEESKEMHLRYFCS